MKTAGNDTCRIFGADTLSEVRELLSCEQEVFVVYDGKVGPFAARAAALCGAPVRGMVALEAGEAQKQMDTVLLLCRSLLEAGIDRGALVLTVGGGIVSDVAGFAACIYRRGVRYANIPTTLLAQTDAAIGGKTGVNFLDYKNMLGVIRQPEWTFLCPEVLETLPRREFAGGAAELLKTFLLADADRYAGACTLLSQMAEAEDFPAALKAHGPALNSLVLAAAGIKADIVHRDPFEGGERRKLNLGHTFAHAIEHCAAVKGDDISHGEAGAMGLVLCAGLSDRLGVSDGTLSRRLTADFQAAGLRFRCPYPLEELAGAMRQDKKSDGGAVRFQMLRAVGDSTEMKLTTEQI